MSRSRALVVWAVAAALGALLLYAGAAKLFAMQAFAQEIANYRFLPGLAPYLAATLPGIELVIGAALILGTTPWRRAAALAALPVLLAFTVAVTQALLRGIDIACGCFGQGSASISGLTVARNLGLLAATVLVLVATRPASPSEPTP